MRLSTKGRYATRIMVCLAMRHGGAPVQKVEIAESEGLTKDYVEQILMKLRTAGLVESHRGVRGGFTIARDPKEITVDDVLRASEGDMVLAPCGVDDCARSSACPTRELWREAEATLTTFFAKHTIADLVLKTKKKARSKKK